MTFTMIVFQKIIAVSAAVCKDLTSSEFAVKVIVTNIV